MSEQRQRTIGALCGLAGSLALVIYFATPALTDWPYGGGSATELIGYANGHQVLFYAGAWLQVTGTLLSVIFFLTVVHLAKAATRLSGLITVVASAVLLSVVLVESAFLMAVPQAAANGDAATVSTTFALSNGVFVRVFPLAPASASFAALGVVILGSGVLDQWFGRAALGIGVAFELVGVVAIFSTVGLILAIILSVGQLFWTVAAAIALARSAQSQRRPRLGSEAAAS